MTKNQEKGMHTIDLVNLVNDMAKTPEFEYYIQNNNINQRLTKLTNSLTKLTKLTTLTTLTKLTTLTNTKEKILLLCIIPTNIKSISEELKVSSVVVSQAMQRTNRDDGLLTQGLVYVNDKDGNVVKYQITQKGAIYLKDIIEAAQEQFKSYEIKVMKEKRLDESYDDIQMFLEQEYLDNILSQKQKGKYYLGIDFNKIIKFNPALGMFILDDPEPTMKLLEMAANRLADFEDNDKNNFEIRLYNLPKDSEILIGNIRTKHLNKLFFIDATIRQKSDVRPKTTQAKFECPSCGNCMTVFQLDDKFKEPAACGCGRKGNFRIVSQEKIDIQSIVIEDVSNNANLVEVKKMHGLISGLLTNEQEILQVGNRVRLIGIIKETPLFNRSGAKLTKSDIILEVKNVHPVHDKRIKLSSQDIEQIKSISNSPEPLKVLSNTFAQHIEGNDHIKQALLLQIVSSEEPVQTKTRKGLNVFVFGDWGLAKSQLNYEACEVADKAIHVEVTKSSAVGLTASVVRDEFLNGWALEAGAVVLAGTGICFIDEVDKSKDDDMDKLGEALEKKTVTISKANIHQTLKAPAKILCAGNIIDNAEIINAKALGIKTHIMDRFDLILKAEKPSDDAVVLKILQNYTGDTNIDNTFLRKYLYYVINNHKLKPMDKDVVERIQYYCKKYRTFLDQYHIQSFARFINSMIRLIESSAKIRLAEKATTYDVDVALSLLKRSIRDRGYQLLDTPDEEEFVRNHRDDKTNKILEYLKQNKDGVKYDHILDVFGEKIETTLNNLKAIGDVVEMPSGTWRVL